VPTTTGFSPERKPLAVLCVLAALALMWATLRPFNPHPHNDVSWLPDTNGVRFGGSGIIWSTGPLQPAAGSSAQDACTIEIYLVPFTDDDAGNFLTFSSDDSLDAVFLRQWRKSLLIYKSLPAKGRIPKLVLFEVDDILRVKRPVLLTISSGPHGTTVYVDGRVARSDPHFRIHPADLYRKMVLGTSPSNFQAWHGEIRGLAIYDEEISAQQAQSQFVGWSTGSFSPAAVTENINRARALYDFSERSGPIIRSEAKSAPALTIPEYFSVPHKSLLASPLEEFDWTPAWRNDVIANVLGFMPFGFVLCGFFALSRPRGQAILISTLVGGLLSFTVEFLQYYIPRRDSSLTDVISNTTGSLLGALIARPELVRFALRLVFLIPPKRKSEATQN
jgi:VanZ family protein